MSFLTEAKNGMKLTEHLDTGKFKSVLLPYFHGVGDVVMVLPIVKALRERYPEIKIDLGLCRGLDQETFVPDAVLLDGDWREKCLGFGYDLVFPLNFPIENLEDTSRTKAEQSCEIEVGIPPVCGHLPIKAKGIITTHFFMTSVPWVSNADSDTAKKVWDEIREAGYVPVDTYFTHCFANPANANFDWLEADNNVRRWPAKLDTLIALLGTSRAFIGVVSGNWHLALSVLGPKKVMLLERDLKVGHFTKEAVDTADLKNYQEGTVKTWLNSLTS